MNTRDLAQQKAYELLKDLGIDAGAWVENDRPDGSKITALSVATCAFMQGWVHGLRDSKEIRRKTLSEPRESYISLLKHQAG